MNKKEKFVQALRETGRANIERVIKGLENTGFFEAPASIRHQNTYAGGLVDHSLAVYQWAQILREEAVRENGSIADQLPPDSVAIAALLHDTCKCDNYYLDTYGKFHHNNERMPFGHGEKSVILLMSWGFTLTFEEILAIRWHMGMYETKEGSQGAKDLKMAMDNCPLVNLIMKADGMATHNGFPDPATTTSTTVSASWDAKAWLNSFDNARKLTEPSRARQLHKVRTDVYTSTLKAVRQGEYISQEGQKVVLDLNPDILTQTVFYDSEISPVPSANYPEMKVEVKGMDCLELAKELVAAEGSEKVCVLNLASWKNPGGGVLRGSGAQEEYLFRCSDYFRSLYQFKDYASQYGIPVNPDHRYPLNEHFGGIFSKGVTIFRGPEVQGYPLLSQPWKVNFIAAAAHSNPPTTFVDGEIRFTAPEAAFMATKVRTILRIALNNGQETLVLGALGCGAFHNPPKHVAEIFKAVLQEAEFAGAFKAVYFAIIDDHNSNGNLAAFRRVFE